MEDKLVYKAIKWNYKAYSILVNELKNDGYRLAYTIVKNQEDSIDAYLQAIEKGMRNIQNLKEAKYFKTWFLRIIINESKDIVAKNSKIVSLEKIDVKNLKEKNYQDNSVDKIDL